MRPLNQRIQCGFSESVIPMAGDAGEVVVFGGVERIGVIAPRSTLNAQRPHYDERLPCLARSSSQRLNER